MRGPGRGIPIVLFLAFLPPSPHFSTMQQLLFEDPSHNDLLPLTYTRPIWDLRVGILKLSEKWEQVIGADLAYLAYGYLGPRFNRFDPSQETIGFNGKYLPNHDFVALIQKGISPNSYLRHSSGAVIAFRGHLSALGADFDGLISPEILDEKGFKSQTFATDLPPAICFPWDIYRLNGDAIREDFGRITAQRKSQSLNDPGTIVYGKDNIFIEEGVKIRAAVLNAEDGPIYIGKNCQIQEGAMVHGTHAFCESSVLNMGAKMRGDTTIGPFSKVGGEIGNSVIQGYSNKGHDGYMGNSVLGYWCNLGADTNTSNLKNNYSEVRVWNYPEGRFKKTGQMFCGLIMGDHSKCGINTMFNTGTVVGVSANIFGGGYPRTFIPGFSWGGSAGFSTYQLRKAYEVAEVVMKRRKLDLEESEKEILKVIFETSASYRSWEKQKQQ